LNTLLVPFCVLGGKIYGEQAFAAKNSSSSMQTTTTTTTEEEKDNSNICGICLEDLVTGQQCVSSSNSRCRHVFHEECIVEWFINRRDWFCPTCRQSFVCHQDISFAVNGLRTPQTSMTSQQFSATFENFQDDSFASEGGNTVVVPTDEKKGSVPTNAPALSPPPPTAATADCSVEAGTTATSSTTRTRGRSWDVEMGKKQQEEIG
jgi:Ring finger domain